MTIKLTSTNLILRYLESNQPSKRIDLINNLNLTTSQIQKSISQLIKQKLIRQQGLEFYINKPLGNSK